jgi:hypothetical protein
MILVGTGFASRLQSRSYTSLMMQWFQNIPRPSRLLLVAGIVVGSVAGGVAGWLLAG